MITEVRDLGFRPRAWQEEVFKSLRRYTILVIHRRAGKTVLALMKLIDAALKCTKPMGRFGYIAPELKQAKLIAWDYLKSYASKVPGFKINESETWVEFANNGARIRLFGADNPDSIRGSYFDGVVLDEVAQMSRSLWGEVVIPAISDRKGWVLFIGTPKGINLFSELYYAAGSKPDEWYSKLITVNDTGLYTPEELLKMRGPGGMTEREYRQEMLCDFMASTDNTLISLDVANAAAKRHIEKRQYSFAPMILGVDVAHEGGDRCVIFPRQGLQSFKPDVIPGIPERDFWGRVASAINQYKADQCLIDITGGYGSEVLSRLNDAGYMAMGVTFSDSDEERFVNKRAGMWFRMAEWMREGSIPNDSALIAELCAPTYDNNNAAMKFQLEAKKKIKERIGVSPDIADALAISFAYPFPQREESFDGTFREGSLMTGSKGPNQSEINYNPFPSTRGSGPVQSDLGYSPFNRR